MSSIFDEPIDDETWFDRYMEEDLMQRWIEENPPCPECGQVGAHYCTGGQEQTEGWGLDMPFDPNKCPICHGTGLADSGGVTPQGHGIDIACQCQHECPICGKEDNEGHTCLDQD